MKDLWLPRTVLEADFLVSMPKIKAHHWSGVTLSMKNMFGVVPGARYGWPKNILHWKGIQESILDLCATVPIHFVIADGIVAMEGNGPLNGTPRALGKIVLADDPVAADATCARLMGFHPDRIVHIREGSRFLGNASQPLIDQVGEILDSRRRIPSGWFLSFSIFGHFDFQPEISQNPGPSNSDSWRASAYVPETIVTSARKSEISRRRIPRTDMRIARKTAWTPVAISAQHIRPLPASG